MEAAAVCGGDLIILRPSIPVHAPFLGYATDSYSAANQKATMGRGTTVKHIYPDELRNLIVPLPSLDEQLAIAHFLDWANGRLELAIRAKRKVIALLKEQKQVIIHRAVTRGIDSSVPLKPSGIPWLGDIPAHWTVQRAKYLYREVDERSQDGSEELLSVSHITGVTPRSQKNITMFKAASYAGHKLCRPGDLVVCGHGWAHSEYLPTPASSALPMLFTGRIGPSVLLVSMRMAFFGADLISQTLSAVRRDFIRRVFACIRKNFYDFQSCNPLQKSSNGSSKQFKRRLWT